MSDKRTPEQIEHTGKSAARAFGESIGMSCVTRIQCNAMLDYCASRGVKAVENNDQVGQLAAMAFTALLYPIVAAKLRKLDADEKKEPVKP